MPKNQDASLLSHAGHYLDTRSGAVVPPIQPSSTYARDEQGELYNTSRTYARDHSDNSCLLYTSDAADE